MIYLTRVKEFEASHRYFNRELSEEENLRIFGKCYSPYGHGHNYRCEVTVNGRVDERSGMVINIKTLDEILDKLIVELDHKFLNNDHAYFAHVVPTTENIACYIFHRAKEELEPTGAVAVDRVRLFEEESLFSDYRGGDVVELTKVFSFSAAHRLHSQHLSDKENRAIFGKCNNPHGHGHNYQLEVTISGEIDQRTGMIADLGQLEQVVDTHVIQKFDHRHLNMEVPPFDRLNPTSENVVKVIWGLLAPHITFARLERVVLRETPRSFFEYRGER